MNAATMGVLVGHEHVIGALERTAEQQRPSHAYVFTGREGIGKKRVAVIFACLLNCPHTSRHRDCSCGVCRRIREEKHPDVIIERPERGRIRIERIRFLQSFFRYAPVEGRFRVIIIDDAHLMNRQAQNALLKTLEEPPPGRILILVTARPFLLLPTVRSRCRRIRFGPLPVDILAPLLEDRKGVSSQRARVIAAMSGGSVKRALEMETSRFMELRRRVISALAEPGKNGLKGILDLSLEISANRDMALQAIEIAMTWIRDLLTAKIGANPSCLIHADFLDMISGTEQHHSTYDLLDVYDELVRASELIDREINANRNMVTDVMLLRVSRMLAGPTLGLNLRET